MNSFETTKENSDMKNKSNYANYGYYKKFNR